MNLPFQPNPSLIYPEIEIHAGRDVIWRVIVEKKYHDLWMAEFSAGTLITEDWKLGSIVEMRDGGEKVTLQGYISVFGPESRLKLEYEKVGYHEELVLTSLGNITLLSAAAGPVEDSDRHRQEEIWSRGLQKIKEISESL